MIKILPYIKTGLGVGAIYLLTSCAVSGNVTKETGNNNKIALEQAQKDSLFYRTILNSSSASGDSSVIAEFNKIASDMKNLKSTNRFELGNEILKNAQNNGIDKYQTNIINGIQYISNKLAIRTKQEYADKFVFEKFLKKHGIKSTLLK